MSRTVFGRRYDATQSRRRKALVALAAQVVVLGGMLGTSAPARSAASRVQVGHANTAPPPPPSYTFTDLGPAWNQDVQVNGQATFTPTGVSDSGEVIGEFQERTSQSLTAYPAAWLRGTLHQLPFADPSPTYAGSVRVVNATGAAAGKGPADRADITSQLIFWHGLGGGTTLRDPGGQGFNVATGIDDAGNVIANRVNGEPDVIVYAGGSVTPVSGVVLNGIGGGYYAGQTQTAPPVGIYGRIQAPGVNIPLDFFPLVVASDGAMAGTEGSVYQGQYVIRLPDGTETRGAEPGPVRPMSINARHQVLLGPAPMYLLNDQVAIPVDSLLPAGWTGSRVIYNGDALDDHSDIVGVAYDNGVLHAFLLSRPAGLPPPIVNSTGDAPAIHGGADGCDTGHTVTINGKLVAECTLRAAIQTENAGSVSQKTITFALPAKAGQIQPATALPSLKADGVTMDGTTGLGGAVVINGFDLNQTTPALDLAGTRDILQGFQFQNSYIAIRIDSAVGGDTVRANVIGVSSGGTTGVQLGVDIENSPKNEVGGATAADRNVISGVMVAVAVHGPAASGNRIQGNWMGVSADGLSTFGDAVGVLVLDASGTLIGGPATAPGTTPGNVIDGTPSASGQLIGISGSTQSAVNNAVQGNLLGLLPDGATQPRGPGDGSNFGVLMVGRAVGTSVGGSTAGTGNVIANFFKFGIDANGTDVSGTQIAGNFIGTTPVGHNTYQVGGQPIGVAVLGARNTTMGIPGPGANVITAQYNGVVTSSTPVPFTIPSRFGGGVFPGTSAAAPGPLGTLIRGNVIGPYADGRSGPTTSVQFTGVALQGNGETLGPGNLISWNGYGVYATGPAETVVGNQIGLDSTGLSALPNGTGLLWKLKGGTGALSDQLTLGVPGARSNAISGNLNDVLLGSRATVQNNLIGTNVFGTAAVNPYSGSIPAEIADNAVYSNPIALLTLAAGSLIGGDLPGTGNVISGNPRDGLDIAKPAVVRGNVIGTALNGAAIPNGRDGIAVVAPSFIGASPTGQQRQPVTATGGNVIANNRGLAVDVQTGGEPTSVLSNSIYGNGGGGIAIQSGGLSAPQFLGLSQDGQGYTVAMVYVSPSTPNDSVVQMFTGDSCSTRPQGKTLLASRPVTNSTSAAELPLQPVGTPVTTTLTIPSSTAPPSTSQFSVCALVQPWKFSGVSPVTVAPSATAVATGIGFAAGQAVNVLLNSSPISLGTYHADARGNVTVSFTVPADLPLGHHDVIFYTTPGGHFAAAGFTVSTGGGNNAQSPSGSPASAPAAGPSVPSTGAATPVPAVGIALLVVGVAALFLARVPPTFSALPRRRRGRWLS